MFWKKKNNVDEQIVVKEAGGSTSGQITNANLKNFVIKAIGFINSEGNNDFESPEYDLSEIKDAINGDSYIKIAIAKYSQLVFKAGYSIVSENDAAAEYVRGRLRMMSFMTGTPIDILFQQTTDDLIAYSNAFWIKSRQKMTNIGGLQAKGILGTDPVCGYYRVDPATVTIKRDKNGTIKQYQQEAGNNKKTFKPEDVVHFYIDKPGGAAYGTPRIVAALEDVKLLRKIEGNILNLIYRFSIPIYQMKIGIPEAGFMATDQEIKEAKKEVEKMANDGVLVTNERTEFKAIGAEGEALDATGYLTYFENRVFSALNASASMMGRGGAKQDADSMEEQIHNTVKFIQYSFSTMLRELVFNELLLEGGMNPIMNESDITYFQFNEINNETRVKMETHALNLFQGNAITFDEARKRIGLRADNVDESRLFANMIQQPNAIALVQAKTGNSATSNSSDGTVSTGTGSEKKSGGKINGSTKNTIQPQNQHGVGNANIKEADNNIKQIQIEENEKQNNLKKNLTDYKKNFKQVYNKYIAARNDICEHGKMSKAKLAIARDSIVRELNDFIMLKSQEGINKAIKDSGKNDVILKKISVRELTDSVKRTMTGIFDDVSKKLKRAKDKKEKEAAFDSLEYRVRFLCDHIASKSYWYAYVKACQQLGIDKVYVNFGQSEDRKNHEAIVNTNNFNLEDIPPFHAYCSCKLTINKKELASSKEKGGEN